MAKACLIFDITPTSINTLVFAQNYTLLYQKSKPLKLDSETDLTQLVQNISKQLEAFQKKEKFEICAINFTSYAGATVHLDEQGEAVAPIYNPTKPLGYKTRLSFFADHGDEEVLKTSLQVPLFTFESAALQLYWIKKNDNLTFQKIKYSLSLPNYLSSLFTKEFKTEYSSIGVHSATWDFERTEYHQWLNRENFNSIQLPINSSFSSQKNNLQIGTGIYNKVAELQTFLATNHEQFILLSTGAWTVCINPFNRSKSSLKDLNHDCFNILNESGRRMKMARLFSGNEHQRQISHLAAHFGCHEDFYLKIKFDREIIRRLRKEIDQVTPENTEVGLFLDSPFMERNLNSFRTVEDAYHQFIMDLIAQQIASIKLTFDHQRNRRIYVEGGLAKNEVFMQLLAEAFHDKQVFKVGFEHTAALGAAILIHNAWDAGKLDKDLLKISLIQ